MKKNITGHTLFYIWAIIFFILFFLHFPSGVFCKDELEVERDKEKTVYTIDSKEDPKQNEDKANAWEMLKNKNFWIEKK